MPKVTPLEEELIVLCGCGRRMEELIAAPNEVLYGCATCIPGQVNVSRKSRGLIETERKHSRACRDQDVARAVEVALANRDAGTHDAVRRALARVVADGGEDRFISEGYEAHDAIIEAVREELQRVGETS